MADTDEIQEWRKTHNFTLESGMKFGVAYRSPSIAGTDLFDLNRFGCRRRATARKRVGFFKGLQKLLTETDRKKWWEHPTIRFGTRYGRISVRLQDLTSGEVKWDAVYDLGPALHKPPKAECDTGFRLCREEKPLGGSHPFFAPDWCPAPNDAMAHKYRLTVRNLSTSHHPEQDVIGEMLFTQYGPRQVADSYEYEASYSGGEGLLA